MEFEVDGVRVAIGKAEEGKDYAVYLLFIEMPETQHHSFLMKRGERILAKGEIAKYLRDSNIEGLEMAAAPPADTNAVVMFRINTEYDVLEKIARLVVEFLKSKEFL
ncbi:hypothetical protein DRP05_12890 [Archaeoglobales archaeon]|nr:MAG: hypothetical protein DRP05_12890 [Archaeoglobales archaeon]